jgi:hypothetical protein
MLYTFRRRRLRMWLVAGLALGIAALTLITVLVAPGSALRLGKAQQEQAPYPADGDDQSDARVDAPQPVAAHPIAVAMPAQAVPILSHADIIAAFDCARGRARLPAYERDAALDREATTLLQRLQRDGEAHLEPGDNGYTLTAQLLLDSAATVDAPQTCEVGGFDIAQVPDLDRSTRIGVALAPVPNAYRRSLYHAVVIGQ